MNECDAIIRTIIRHYPNAEAIYLFGSYGREQSWTESDVDIAVLLPQKESKILGSLMMSNVHFALESLLKKDVDIINLRQVATVLQKEVVTANRRIYARDTFTADEFEMLTLSYYQKLNEERAEIVTSALKSGRFI